MRSRVGVLDLGVGNVTSVLKSLHAAGAQPSVANTHISFDRISHLVLPGVGSFGTATERLNRGNFRRLIQDWASEGRPLLGICLGMQLLFDSSEESDGAVGLGILRGHSERLPGNASRIGWGASRLSRTAPDLPSSARAMSGAYLFYNHNFHVRAQQSSAVVAESIEVPRVAVAVGCNNTLGVQFHPERSQHAGIRFLRAWLDGGDGS